MLLIIIGIAIFIAGGLVIERFNNPILFIIGILCVMILGALSQAPISGYEEIVLQETYELKPIYEPNIYVIEDSNGDVTCNHIIKNEHPEAVESYGKYIYSSINYDSVEVVVAKEGSKPIMKKYYAKAKKTIWTFAVHCDKTKYVFYVPEENIERWQNVHVN